MMEAFYLFYLINIYDKLKFEIAYLGFFWQESVIEICFTGDNAASLKSQRQL